MGFMFENTCDNPYLQEPFSEARARKVHQIINPLNAFLILVCGISTTSPENTDNSPVWQVEQLFKGNHVSHSRSSVKIKSAFILNVKHQISSV